MLDDYSKANPEVKDLPRLGIEPRPPNPQPVVIAHSYKDLSLSSLGLKVLRQRFHFMQIW